MFYDLNFNLLEGEIWIVVELILFRDTTIRILSEVQLIKGLIYNFINDNFVMF